MGRTTWMISAGHIPLRSTGREPENTSRDELCFLNAGYREAQVEVTLFYADREPVGPYRLEIPPRRIRRVRVNNLINPEAPPLDTDYGAVIESNVPIVVQFERTDTSDAKPAMPAIMGFAT
ncbi:hypothetical protein SAMN05660653_01579 [Desulfonatronum thiosulfatophilum]|uniref:Sensory rhodopsin transducer n=1 Tax=Desulfonatronum thiosulfatophilum TaxID=617002 RepID=A0A1G6CJN5_9BACT|nr:sensory rhodopsin transducer [Desulfonatronum thiosulfatophilum]SDB33066.1 hypothetical protein SAMN05660653_01579 [Desulfonatronum thiosulfatophilum]